MTYLRAAEAVGRWLLATADRRPEGWCWPTRPGVSTDVSAGLGWGTAAPTLFFVEAYRTTGTEQWLDAAREGARWMSNHLDECVERTAGCGLFTGVGGWAVVLDELAVASDDEAIREQARRVLATVADRATVEGARVHWHDLTEILWGTAGIGCLMLEQGRRYLGGDAVELATKAGTWLLQEAERAPTGGIRWSLGRAHEAENPADVRRFPNFAHGAAGIAFFLSRLTEVTGEGRFGQGAQEAFDWIKTTLRTDDGCAAFHHDPGGTQMFTLGWCHGPPGLGWLFRQLEITTGDPEWRSWLRRAALTDRFSGIPEQREPGFWDNVGRCCGSAGVAEFFLDLHSLEGNDDDLGFATVMIDDILDRATEDEAGMRWSNVEFRSDTPNLPPETTYLQGAPGIGSTLLRLHRHLSGDAWTVRWPHSPQWHQRG